MKSKSFQIILAFAIVYLVWGSTYLAIRFVVETLPVFTMAGLRFFLAGVILFAYCYQRKLVGRLTWTHWMNTGIIGGLLLLGGNGSVVWAEQYVPSGLAALFIATVPWWMVILEWVLFKGSKPTLWTILGLLLGLVGVGVLVLPAFKHAIHLEGTLVLLMAAFWWSLGSVYTKKADLPSSPFTATAMEMMLGGLLLLVVGFFQGEWTTHAMAHGSTKSFIAFFYLLVAGSLLGFTSYIWLLNNVKASLVSTYAFVNPVVAVFLGCLLASEKLNSDTILAAVMIILAVILITLGQRPTRTKSAAIA